MTLQSHGLEGRRKGRRGGMGGEEEWEGRRKRRRGKRERRKRRIGRRWGRNKRLLGRQLHVINTVSFPCGLGTRHLEPIPMWSGNETPGTHSHVVWE